MSQASRRLPWDWYPGTIPDNVVFDETSYIETSYSFLLFRSEAPVGARIGRGASVYKSTMLDVGPGAQVTLGDYALVHGARIICDAGVTIGEYALISWNVVLMDSYRVPIDPGERRLALARVPGYVPRRPSANVVARAISIARNVWIGFEACVLPGVTIGEGAIVGARSVVVEDVAPFTIVAGNPARFIRRLDPGDTRGSASAA
jgi:acetyltransferase-like isoleucine patch superfamily enzyme